MPLAFTTDASSHPRKELRRRKISFKPILLLQILIPGVVMLSSLETINPWLSACDLKQQAPSNLRGSCSAPIPFPTRTTDPQDVELLCPKECQPNESKTNASCLAYLDETRRNAICNFNLGNGIEWLKSFLGTIRLRHCCEYKIIESLSSSLLERVLRGKDECFSIVDSLVEVDNLAAHVTCQFSEMLSRYDCGKPYSVKFSCHDCLEAYRRWTCSTLVPYFNDSVRIRPCRSVCQAVEQRCPFFLPENKAPSLPTQYAGEPAFLCMDPNIPEAGKQQKKSLYPDEETCCVKICGSLKDGLCVDKASSCKSEELISYEEALDQVVECPDTEAYGFRPSTECTASEPYSSPHKLGSGAATTYRGPSVTLLVTLALIACLLHLAPELPAALLTAFVLPIALFPVTLLLLLIPDSPWRSPALRPLARVSALVLHFLKRPTFVLNYLKFLSKKWQYYFILISVNLKKIIPDKTPLPLLTPVCLVKGFDFGEETRRARRFYYIDYCYYYYKHYYTILLNIAQNPDEGSRRSRESPNRVCEHLNLFNSKIRGERSFVRLKNVRLTLNKIKINRGTVKILINNFGESNRFAVRKSRRRTRRQCRRKGKRKRRRRRWWWRRRRRRRMGTDVVPPQEPPEEATKSERKFNLDLVEVYRFLKFLCSDPECQFQTFYSR